MKVDFLESFSNDLDLLTDNRIKKALKNAIIKVENADSVQQITGLRKLKGEKDAFRLRVGDYRIGIYIEKDRIIMARVAHRKTIYNLFP